jgi:tRNA A-37 threonylcarbamoyl transferase component Bud32
MGTTAQLNVALSGRYTIVKELGQGGMATVYLAHDVRHDRNVALKVLRPELSAILGAERFLAEIKTTANLQHPHILSLFDSGEADGTVFYVMPYVEGESLRDRIKREQQLPIDEAVRITREVLDALEYAHQHRVVHRDIKPENILLHGGHAMVADFGIALAASKVEGSTRMTETGMSLGTPHYMSPEQAMGERVITGKADVYATGCVLYEMLTGEPPFTGSSAQAVFARVLTDEPRPLTLQRKTIPPHVEGAVRTALQKLPADRFASAAHFAEALGNATFTAAAASPSVAARNASRLKGGALRYAPWAIALAAISFAGVLARPTERQAPPAVLRYEIAFNDSVGLGDAIGTAVALAPDGSSFVYSSRRGLMLRHSDKLETTPVPGAGRSASDPFYSHDGRWIGYHLGVRLVKVPLDGGSPLTICDSCPGYSFDWGTDDTIRYHAQPTVSGAIRTLMAIPASGGRPQIIAQPDSASGEAFRTPIMIPGRRAVLFTLWSGTTGRLASLDLDRRTVTRFDVVGSGPHWVDPGFVVLAGTDGSVTAVPFDARRVRPSGAPTAIARDVQSTNGYIPRIGASRSGTVVYVQATSATERRLAFVTRTGIVTDIPTESKSFAAPRLSPDGRRLATTIADDNGGMDVWVLDLSQRVWSRLTTDRISERPIWTPDGRRIVYSSTADLWWVAANLSERPDSLLISVGARYAASVFPDGKAVLFNEDGSGHNGIRALVFDSAPAARTLIPMKFGETAPSLSPDGKWIAYQSDETGRTEIYVHPYPGPGARIPVSIQGGTEPLWSRNGRELFYRVDDSLMVATVSTTPSFTVSGRRRLFTAPFLTGRPLREYDVSPDGQRFVMVRGSDAPLKLISVHHFFERLARDGAIRP